MSEINFLKYNFKPKYEKLFTGTDYNECFSDIDGWLFYNSFEHIGVLNFSKEVRQKEWDECRSDLKWWKNDNRLPNKQEVINRTKAMLFKSWILAHFEIDSTVDEIFDLIEDNKQS